MHHDTITHTKRVLRRCARTLTTQGFTVAPGVPGDERGFYIVVLSMQPLD
jgi:hypothetical protein